MNIFSTTQPPKFWAFGPLSTTQPPSRTQSLLAAMSDGPGLLGLIRKGIASLRNSGSYPHMPSSFNAGAINKPDTEVMSGGAFALLASEQLLTTLQVQAARWGGVTSDVPEFSVAMKSLDGTPPSRTHPSKLIKADEYRDSVKKVKGPVNGPKDKDRIRFEAPHPTLALAMALGMDSEAGTDLYRYAYTALVIDVVVDVVSAPVHRLKDLMRVDRPTALSWGSDAVAHPGVVDEPRYTAYPGGHAAVCAAAAVVLSDIVVADAGKRTDLSKLGRRIADGREAAGLHTQLDTQRGWELGEALGLWMVDAAASSSVMFPAWRDLSMSARKEWNP